MSSDPRFNINFGTHSYPTALFEVVRNLRSYNNILSADWYVEEETKPVIEDYLYRYEQGNNVNYLYDYWANRCLVQLNVNGNKLDVLIAADSPEAASAGLRSLTETYPPILFEKGSGRVPVSFWSRGSDGSPTSVRREIDVPAWTEIEANYPSLVRHQLSHLMTDYVAHPEGGKLILWTGEPGTGKTFALRSLAREWSTWCDIHYVVDPESFFTGPLNYLFQVALAEDTSWRYRHDEDWETAANAAKERWRLIVCEDTGELLAADAKDRTGTALGRFLNVCDGIIGQGLRVQILITTNEDIRTFHPAVVRPGRAVSQIRFEHFSAIDAAEWLEDRTVLDQGTKSYYTLAELYAMSRGESIETLSKKGSGFLT